DRPEAGDRAGRRIDDVEPAERRRGEAEEVVENEDEEEPEEEGGRRLAGGRDDAAEAVDGAARLHRRADTEGNAETDRQDQRREGELQRSRQPVGEVIDHRLAGGQRIAEVALRQALDIGNELRGDAAIEDEAMTRLLDRGGW